MIIKLILAVFAYILCGFLFTLVMEWWEKSNKDEDVMIEFWFWPLIICSFIPWVLGKWVTKLVRKVIWHFKR